MTGYQIPRSSLAWLLAAQAVVIAPHIARLPVWVTLVCIACIGWCVMIYQGRWRYPGRWTRLVFVIAGVAGVPLQYHSFFGVEPWVAILIIAYALKLLEMHHKRDAYTVVLLGYFVAMTEFLFHQSIVWSLYTIVAVTLITAGLIGLNQTRSHQRPMVTLRTALILLAQSVPLMLVLFVLFPRIPPLWAVPLPGDVARTGVSDSMSPGDIARLSRSSDLAFKVRFDGSVPPNDDLYWRGLVLSRFDGRTWTQEPGFSRSPWVGDRKVPKWTQNIERLGDTASYSIILEPTEQHWLFSLAAPDLPHQHDVVMLKDFLLASKKPVDSKLNYRVSSALDYHLGRHISDVARSHATELPAGDDPRSRALAARLYGESTGTRDYIHRVLEMYRTGGFVYTLEPPKLTGKNSIDQFLFNSKQGFCEHYAGSFVFLMRAANIPARVVVGYQGGAYNQFGNYLSIYQYDAHAWAEVWLPGAGWVREDPITVVAPARIQDGFEGAVHDDASLLAGSSFSLWGRQTLWLANLRLALSAVGYYWDSWVVGYTPESQMDVLTGLLGHVSRARIGLFMLALFFSVLAVVGFFILMKRPLHRLQRPDRVYLKFCRALQRQGVKRRVGEGPSDYARRVVAARPELAELVNEVTRNYVALSYGGGEEAQNARLSRAVRSLRIKVIG